MSTPHDEPPRVPGWASAFVLTASDASAAGVRPDASGRQIVERLAAIGFGRVDTAVVPDEQPVIEAALREAAAHHDVIVTTGGTGLTPRDVTPQATRAVLDYEVPGLAEAIRAAGRVHTPLADLSRGVVGVVGRALVINVPGSPRAAMESLSAIESVLAHAIETLAGPYDHGQRPLDDAGRPTEPKTGR